MAQQTITAFYDSREYANNAVLMLEQAGVPESGITVSPETAAAEYPSSGERPATGFWATLESMFAGSDDHGTYGEGLRRGGVMVAVRVDDAKVDDAVRILEEHGSIDLDERETTWRSEGWTGGAAITGGGDADTGAGPLRSMTSVADTRPTVRSETAAFASEAAPAATARTGADADVLQVVEESLTVGKRAVNRGKVRIHSYVVETPVTEAVSLRDESVTVERRPVDRPLSAAALGADPFKDRTIEMQETDEEAVVGKSTRVVEEIGIRKTVSDRTETVSDTVRSTKVDVEDGRTAGHAAGLVGRVAMDMDIAKDMEVVGSDGGHVGLVDHADGATIKLKKNDPASGGTHHLIPADWVQSVDAKVMLKTTAADAKLRWTAA